MIYLLLAAGFEESEALVPLDLLRRAGLTVKTVAITADPVTGSHGVTVLSDINADAATEPIDLLILPGGMPGTKNLDASPHVDRLLENTQSDGGRIAAICAAPMVLGKRGLLRGKRATCYPGFEENLKGALLCGDGVVTDGKCITAKGAGVTQSFAFAIVQALVDEQTAQKLRSEMQCQ